MKLIEYNEEKHLQDWDMFVNKSNNGTIFHLRKFLSYHKKRNFADSSILFSEKDKIKAVFSAALLDNAVMHSHPGASFGGFVYNQLTFRECNLILDLLIEYLQHNKIYEIIIIPTPFIYHRYYNQNLEYCLLLKGFNISEYYISSIIPLNINNPLNNIHKRKKRYINKVHKQLEVKISDDLDAFYPILLENKTRHQVKPTHTLAELKILQQKFPNRIKLLLTYKKNKIIGGTLNFITNSATCIMFYNMILYEYVNLQPASFQIYKTIEWAKEQKLQFIDLGVSQKKDEKSAISPHESLIHFKEQFGAIGMMRKVIRLKL